MKTRLPLSLPWRSLLAAGIVYCIALANTARAGVLYSYTGEIVTETLSPGTYSITVDGGACGADISNVTQGGMGAAASGQITFATPVTLSILVGQAGGSGTAGGAGGAAAGSFVWLGSGPGSLTLTPTNTLLLAAGGGGGGANDGNGADASLTTSGGPGGGTGGLGGGGFGGAGIIGNGGSTSNSVAIDNGGAGAPAETPGGYGGFGGGGYGGPGGFNGGGGGGYSGGGGTTYLVSATNYGASGGGSYVNPVFTNSSLEVLGSAGDGSVFISLLAPPGLATSVVPEADSVLGALLLAGVCVFGVIKRRMVPAL